MTLPAVVAEQSNVEAADALKTSTSRWRRVGSRISVVSDAPRWGGRRGVPEHVVDWSVDFHGPPRRRRRVMARVRSCTWGKLKL